MRGGKHLWHLFSATPARVASFGPLRFLLHSAFWLLYFLQDAFFNALSNNRLLSDCHSAAVTFAPRESAKNISEEVLLPPTPVLWLSLEPRRRQPWLCCVFPSFGLMRRVNANGILTAATC